jgi:hypothetical protein
MKTFIKIIKMNENHYIERIKNNLNEFNNIDPQFLTENIIYHFINNGGTIKKINLDYEHVYINAIIIYGWELFCKFIDQTKRICMVACKLNPSLILYVTEQFLELSLLVVQNDGLLLGCIKDQTELICLHAIKNNPFALTFVRTQTVKISMYAIEQDYDNLKYIKHQTEKMCLVCIEANVNTFKHVKRQTEKICLAALEKDLTLFHYVKNKSRRICEFVISKNPLYLEYITNQSLELCIQAVSLNPTSLIFVKDQTEQLCLLSISQDPTLLKIVQTQTEQICLESVKQKGLLIMLVKNKTRKICIEALKEDYNAIRFIDNPSEDLILEILNKENLKILKLIKKQSLNICNRAIELGDESFLYIDKLTEEMFKKNPTKIKYFYKSDKEYLDLYSNGLKLDYFSRNQQEIIFRNIKKNITKKDLLKFPENWQDLFLNYLDYFELTLHETKIEFKDLENNNKYTKENNKTIKLFENYNQCVVCYEKKLIFKSFCVNYHSDGICFDCHDSLKEHNLPCCICRHVLI